MIAFVIQIAIEVAAAILAITLHEAAHGYAALALGDDTAKLAGRLSLNPLRHVDRTGTIILPGLLLIGQLLTLGRVEFMFGWAKPVPVGAWKFRDPRRGMALVAAAGPAMNFFLAWLGALAAYALPHLPGVMAGPATGFLQAFILYNLVLGLFNLIPVPPLDGGRIVVGLLPLPLARVWAGIERQGILLVLLVVFILPLVLRQFGVLFDPVQAGLMHVLPWAEKLVLRLAGHHV